MSSKLRVAILPAAGYSRRMNSESKLLLPWSAGRCVLEEVVHQWVTSRVDRIIVVMREDDTSLHRACPVHPKVQIVVPPVAPEDMKASIARGIEWIAREAPGTRRMAETDRWLVAPTDMPTLSSSIIDRILAESEASSTIVVPRYGGRRGHPLSLPWALANRVRQLGAGEGIKRLLDEHPVAYVDLDRCEYPEDIDTFADYQRLRGEFLAAQGETGLSDGTPQ